VHVCLGVVGFVGCVCTSVCACARVYGFACVRVGVRVGARILR
jgi:hypothetical protein